MIVDIRLDVKNKLIQLKLFLSNISKRSLTKRNISVPTMYFFLKRVVPKGHVHCGLYNEPTVVTW